MEPYERLQKQFLNTFTESDLIRMGFDEDLIHNLSNDSCQKHTKSGFLGALILNYLGRQDENLQKSLTDSYVSAYRFAKIIGRPMNQIMKCTDNGRDIVTLRGKGNNQDYYIAIADLHTINAHCDETSTITELATMYYNSKDPKIRDMIIRKYEPKLHQIAGKWFDHCMGQVDYLDFLADAYLGLHSALEHFNPKHGVKFNTYSYQRIDGTIVDCLREMDIIARNWRKKIKIMESRKDDFYNTNMRPPTKKEEKELWISSGFSESLYREYGIIQQRAEGFVSLDQELEFLDNNPTVYKSVANIKTIDPLQEILDKELFSLFKQDIQDLPIKFQTVVHALDEGRDAKAIGSILNVSESRIIQMITEMYENPEYFSRYKEYKEFNKEVELRL